MRRPAAVAGPAAVLCAVLLAAVVPATRMPAVGQTAEPSPGDPDVTAAAPTDAVVTLDALDGVVPSGTEVRFAVLVAHTGDVPWDRIEVVADLHAALGSRSALRAALDGGVVPRRVRRAVETAEPVAPLGPGGLLRVNGSVPLAGTALTGTDTAVHPLRLRVLADGVEVGRVATAIVRIGAAPAETLATTLVWPLAVPPARDAAGAAIPVDAHTVAGGRLDTLLGALEGTVDGGGDGAVEGAVTPTATIPVHLLEDLARRSVDDGPGATRAAAQLERLRAVAAALPEPPLVTPYADADVAALLASAPSLRPLATRALRETEERTAALLGRSTAPAVLLEGSRSGVLLDALPVRTVVVPYTALDAPDLALDEPLPEPVRTLRSPTGRRVTALVGDPYLTLALGTSTRAVPADPVRAAQDVLVRTAMVHLEAPGRAGRALVLLPPDGFDPDPRFADELLTRLAAAPWLRPAGVEGALAASAGARPAARLADTTVAPLPATLADALTATARDLALLVRTVDLDADDPGADPVDDAGDPGAGGAIPVGARTLGEASDELLRATSRRTGVAAALPVLAGVRADIDAALGEVTITVDDVTLTDREGTVPITLSHAGVLPVRTRVEVVGPAALTWPDGRVREVTFAAVGERSIELPVRSGATGRFPVRVSVTDPSGTRELATVTVGVRATALAGPALVLIGATVLVLLVVGSVRQRRRGLAWPPAGRDADPDGADVGSTGPDDPMGTRR